MADNPAPRRLTPEEKAWLRGADVPATAGNPSVRTTPEPTCPAPEPHHPAHEPDLPVHAPHHPVPEPVEGTRLGRRTLLLGTLGVTAATGGAWGLRRTGVTGTGIASALGAGSHGGSGQVLSAGSAGEAHAHCVAPSSLLETGRIGSATLSYEVDHQPRPMRFDAGFHAQLRRWLLDWNATSRHGGVTRIGSYGAWVAKDACHSWHAEGRAFDVARLMAGDELLVSCRNDLWSQLPPAQQAALRRRYWALAASLHLHFAYVLTYHFDDAHRNHIHVDNGVSGGGMSRFDPQSRVQNQAVQEICATLWNQPGEVTGEWADARRQVAPVLDRLGVSDLTRQATWQRLLRASVPRG